MRCLSTGLGVALGWLGVALCSPLSDFSFQLSAFQLLPKGGSGWLARPFYILNSAFFLHSWVAFSGGSRFKVQGSRFGIVVGCSMLDAGFSVMDVGCSGWNRGDVRPRAQS